MTEKKTVLNEHLTLQHIKNLTKNVPPAPLPQPPANKSEAKK